MLHITVPEVELFDERTEEFVNIGEQNLVMEHSLISISKWEAKWHKSYFVDNPPKTEEEVLDYLRCMTIHPQKVDPLVYSNLGVENLKKIEEYINDPMTATTINDNAKQGNRRQIITSELVYYWMIAQNIPPEYEKWHINRLLTLIRVCSIKNDPNPKKMNRGAIARQNRALNAARRKKFNTRG